MAVLMFMLLVLLLLSLLSFLTVQRVSVMVRTALLLEMASCLITRMFL
uniref:Uncharacterized protein n=1 Tax=Siphoviridae sp. ctLqe90 TaxID=2825456 RepID=A0A8S5Q1X1_9CAUD|nr:MAG TPA: hypothetical protein [Siphoviridae sp. ctLqe90]